MAAYIESYTGSSGIRPFATRKSILYIDSSLNTVSNFVYSYELNGYSGQNLDILARDLMDGYVIRDISYRDTPYGVMYAVRSDGVLLGLTYLREENIYAWHMHTTKDGFFRSICSVDQDENDLVYCAVERYGKNILNVSSHILTMFRILTTVGILIVPPELSVTGENIKKRKRQLKQQHIKLMIPTAFQKMVLLEKKSALQSS